jgi:RNA polymerase sigma-70 factor, ECF subfamily
VHDATRGGTDRTTASLGFKGRGREQQRRQSPLLERQRKPPQHQLLRRGRPRELLAAPRAGPSRQLAGALHVTVETPTPVTAGPRLWSAASLGLHCAWQAGVFELQGGAEAIAPLARRDYVVERADPRATASLFEEAPVGIMGNLGAGGTLLIERGSGMPEADCFLSPSESAEGLLKDSPTAHNYTETNGQRRVHCPLAEPPDPKAPSTAEVSAKLETIYAECARFVWLSLQRAGVRQADLDDVCQDVFVIVQRKLPEFREGAKVRPWLLAICARTAANYRRRAHVRLEQSSSALNDGEEDAVGTAPEMQRPDHELARRRALQRVESILSRMTPLKRAVFVMFEVEGMTCLDIAAELGLPVGTVYSRLHSARKIFLEQAARTTAPAHSGDP